MNIQLGQSQGGNRNVMVINTMYQLRIFRGIFCFILLFNFAIGKSCNTNTLVSDQCAPNQWCDESTQTCQCLTGFEALNSTHCHPTTTSTTKTITTDDKKSGSGSTPNTSSLVDDAAGASETNTSSSGSIVAGILIPIILILIVIYGVYLNRKNNWWSWVRRKITPPYWGQNGAAGRGNYDEFMIGQDLDDDDPPLR